MASMKLALSQGMDTVVSTFNAATTTISVVGDAALILKSYSSDMLEERRIEQAAEAEHRLTRVVDNAARAVVDHQLSTVAWISSDPSKAAMFKSAQEKILARLS